MKKIGKVFCRICETKYTYPINGTGSLSIILMILDLTREAHVFGRFIEDCENANK
jgi:hypothetical protein